VSAVEANGRATTGLVATVGRLDVEPGASNVIAGRARATLDVRHADDGVRLAAVHALKTRAEEIAAARGLTIGWRARLDQPATPMSPAFVAVLERAVERVGVPAVRLTSGAGHDAMIVARLMPAAMLFLRSPGGISHHSNETVREDDVARALAAGLEFLPDPALSTKAGPP
jgi:allantoate deiminase